MRSGVSWPAFAVLLLIACAPQRPPVTVLEEVVPLVRGAHVDLAQREIEVDDASIVVAFVEEERSDVRLKISRAGEEDAASAVEVESNLDGIGTEIAMLEVDEPARITLTMTGPQDSREPGSVRLSVKVYPASGLERGPEADRLQALRLWSDATRANFRADKIKAVALPNIDAAIAKLEGPKGDAALAARAHLLKANMLHYFRVDWRAARAEAQRAMQAFAKLPQPEALNAARSRYIEALALIEISMDPLSENPTSTEAAQRAREILGELCADDSVLFPLGRARALTALGVLDINAVTLDDADRRFNDALAIYQSAGHLSGIREVRIQLAAVLLARGRFFDAARAFDELMPEFDRITNPDKRISAYFGAGRSQAFSGRTDEAAENMLKALALARQYKVRVQEGRAMQGLGHLYQNQADVPQARTFFTEALKIIREENDSLELVWALGNYGVIARADRDFPRAIELHKEAVRRSSNPVGVVRSLRELGLDYAGAGDGPAAIAAYRQALAVKLQDPRHHAYSDVKRNLANALIEFGDGSPATLDEAGKLLADTLEDCIRVRDHLGEIGARRVTAMLLAAQGQTAAAKAEYERTFAAARTYRARSANSEVHAGSLQHEQVAFRGYLDLALAGVKARGPGKPQAATADEVGALRTLELARDAHFGATRTGALDSETTARVDTLLGQMADMSVRIAALLKQEVTPAEESELAELQFAMSKLRADLESVRTAAAVKHAANERAKPIAARAWRELAPGVVQLSYALGEKHAYVWARSRDGIRVAMLAAEPQQLEAQLTEVSLLDPQIDPAKIELLLARVSSLLLPDGLLPATSTAVEIVAEGRIAGVPFPGLHSPANRSRRLVETHTVTMINSLYDAEERVRSSAHPFKLVALASGNGALRSVRKADSKPRLQAATQEIRDVAALFERRQPDSKVKLLLGAEGNAPNLRGIWSSGVDVVHFATHALADLRQPLASLLVMPATTKEGAATYLTAGQVRDWRGDTNLVFLSACESAVGPPRFAAGMPGLQHAFLRAGARGVIATLWPIEDVLARDFSSDFYERFTAGTPASLALRETQRAWLAGQDGHDGDEAMRRRITALAHAYYTR